MFQKRILVTILFFAVTFGQLFSQESINQLDENGKRDGVWKKYYNNKRIRYQGQFRNGKEIGTFKYYDITSSDFPTLIKKFESNNDSASVSFFTVKGVLTAKGKMLGKNRVGKWEFYHKDGKTKMSEENYKDGVLEGNYYVYYKTGVLTESSFYKAGKLHNNSKTYSDLGILLNDLNYVNGKLHGNALIYNVKGDLIMKGVYEDDRKIGKWQYFEDGKPVGANRIKSK